MAKTIATVPVLAPLVKAFAKDASVDHYKATALRVGSKVFAMVVKGELVFKLPADRAAALVQAGKGELLVMGGRAMKEWFVSPAEQRRGWVALGKEAKRFAQAKK